MREPPASNPGAIVGLLYDLHGAALYRYALMLLADAAAADDAVQQVFTTLLRRGPARLNSPAHYLRRAVRNECYSALRRRRAEAEVDRPLLEPVAPEPRTPDERIGLERALRRLPAEQREVIHLHVFEGLTFLELSDELGLSINTVASRYRYGLEKLRATLADARRC